jgi:zinc protease
MALKVESSELKVGLAPTRERLDNGVVVLTKETHTTPAAAINIAVRAGSVCDPADAPGATFLLSRVIDRGTATRSAEAIAEELDSRGITVTITVTRHVLSLVCTCLAEDFEAVFALLGDMLTAPTLPDGELAKRKGEVITAIRQDEDNPAVRATEALMALLYPDGHPYGRRTKGSVETIERLTRNELAALHDARFAPTELSAVVVGAVDAGRVREATERVFGRWRAPAPPPVVVPHVAPATRRQRLVIPMMNKAQTDVAYGFTTIARTDPSYYAYWLMNHVLGQYSLSGRLGASIRERQGMAYYVYSTLDANVVEGPLLVRAGVGPANVDRTIASIDDEIRNVATSGVTAEELEDSRRYLVYAMPRALETNAGIANFLQTAEFFDLGLDYDVRLPGLLSAVTLDEVHAVARRSLDPERAVVVIAGPYQE